MTRIALLCATVLLAGCERAPSEGSPDPRPRSGKEGTPSSQSSLRIEPVLEDGPSNRVIADEHRVILEVANGRRDELLWQDVRRISVVTTDRGPRFTDVFFVLDSSSSRLVVPQDAVGNEALVVLLTRIKGFDHHSFIEAMGSSDNAEFSCWSGSAPRFRPTK
jgi:hypothetical protein